MRKRDLLRLRRREAKEYAAMIQRQGEEAAERGRRILAAYKANDERVHLDRSASGGVDWRGYQLDGNARHPMAGPAPMPSGTPLASRIAAATASFQTRLASPLEDRERYVVRRKWWQFWLPTYVPGEPIEGAPGVR